MRLTLATITDEQREHLELCIHESSHSVAGCALSGILRNAVVLNSTRLLDTQGLTTFDADTLPPGAAEQIAYAGPYGQARFRAGGRHPTMREMLAVLDGTGRGDCKMLTAAGGPHLGHAIKPLIERCWPAVVRVAQQLHRDGEVLHADVCKALGITDGGGRTSVQLASLRSGWGRQVPPLAETG